MRKILFFSIVTCLSLQVKAQCTATITPLGSTNFCQGGNVSLVASPGDIYQWFLNGNSISGATNDTFVANVAGSYTVEIDSVGCISVSIPETVTVNTAVPAQPGPISGADTTCNGGVHTYSTTAVPGATSYAWSGVSTLGMFVGLDTTVLPTITGNVLPAQSQPITNIYVRALNGCGASLYSSVKQVADISPPQWGGSWNVNDIDVADNHLRVCPGTEYTLHPVIHGAPGPVYTDTYTLQWYEDNIAIPGATGYNFLITRGGNYSVKANTHYCGATYTFQKKVYQDVPNSITISPPGPLSFCVGNATPITVSFDMAGVSDSISWDWICFADSGFHWVPGNALSILPDTSGYYTVWASSYNLVNCRVQATNGASVTMPPPLEVTQIDDTLYATPSYSSYQWFENNVAISGATSQSFVLSFDGIYSVEATFSNGCVETSDTFDSDYMLPPPQGGGGNEQMNGDISISPNPVIGSFKLAAKIPVEDNTASIYITDVTGKIIFEKTIQVTDGLVNEEIDIADGVSCFGILKLRSKGANLTMPFFKK